MRLIWKKYRDDNGEEAWEAQAREGQTFDVSRDPEQGGGGPYRLLVDGLVVEESSSNVILRARAEDHR